MYLFIIKMPLTTVTEVIGKSLNTVTDWFNMCREVCTSIVSKKAQLEGTAENPIQIDEAGFAGRRKCNRSWLLAGDVPRAEEDEDADLSTHGITAHQGVE